MIRLTLLLVVCIGVTMVVAGRDTDGTANSGGAPLAEVSRSDSDPAALIPTENRLALDDEDGAIQRALTASGQPASAEEPAGAAVAAEPDVAVVAEETPGAGWYVTGNRVNLRAGPSTREPVVGQVTYGQSADLLDETDDGWMHIRVSDTGLDAYIYGKFLSPENPG